MRRRRHTNTDLFIDLTSLLDVIFIILAMYMCIFSDMAKRIQAENNLTGPVNGAAEVAEDIENYILIESVYSSFDISHPEERTISFAAAASTSDLESTDNVRQFEIVSEDTEDRFGEFEKALRESISTNSDKDLIILKLNRGEKTLLYRDEKRILELFDSLKNEYPNISIK